MSIDRIVKFTQTLPDGTVNVMTRPEMMTHYVQWAEDTLSATELVAFHQARERNLQTKDLGQLDPEAVVFFEQYSTTQQVVDGFTDFITHTFYRPLTLGIGFFKQNPYDGEFAERTDLDYGAVYYMWSNYYGSLTVEEQLALDQAIQTNYQGQIDHEGPADTMPVTEEFEHIWQEFLNRAWLYEYQGDSILTEPTDSVVPPPPPPDDEFVVSDAPIGESSDQTDPIDPDEPPIGESSDQTDSDVLT